MATAIVLDKFYDPFNATRAVYAEVRVPGDSEFDALDTDARGALLDLVLSPAGSAYRASAARHLDSTDFDL